MDNALRGNDPGSWGHSLANLAEIMFPVLDAAEARSVVEIGSYEGDLTRDLLGWAEGVSARDGDTVRVSAIEPAPQDELVELSERHPELELIRETSHEALRHIPLPDAVIVDGDHNYYTVHEELRLIDERSSGADLPLLLFHDVGWPHGRRDAYYVPEEIPEEYRDGMVRGAHVFPGDPGLVPGGLPYRWAAKREGGPRNGVLTAIEDFAEGREELRLALVPAFFGFGVLWRRDARWAGAVAEIVDPWDRNPLVARLEANRVFHLANEHVRRVESMGLRERLGIQEGVLRMMLGSRAFAVGEQLSRLRKGGRPMFSRDEVKRALGETEPR
ncbi:MAG: class I SAM-dependent methyltransferase [Solirubrobacterales bacterium]